MRHEPGLTYQGALHILGHYDRPWIEKLDSLLGGVILGAGMAAGAAALSGPALAPLGALAAFWGWIEQKDQALVLLRRILDKASSILLRSAGYERYRLVAAVHTMIVAAAFFETLEEQLGSEVFKTLKITQDERVALTIGPMREVHTNLVEALYNAHVPAPSPARGFEENISYVGQWLTQLTVRTETFLEGLSAWKTNSQPLGNHTTVAAIVRYRSRYLQMAATVPEFLVWASLGEHAASRTAIRDVRDELLAAITSQGAALARMETMLSLAPNIRETEDSRRNVCAVVHRFNREALDEHIVSEEAVSSDPHLTFPMLRQAFINPRYRLGRTGPDARPADENWWSKQPTHGDLDLLLAGQVTAPDAAYAPMLLLGHPGAGKSLLTKMLAARLPPWAYTAVRVALRRVEANAPVYEQIQQALDQATHRRVDWWELAEQSASTVRIVLLDGLDELLQAAGHRSGYLQEVAEFQIREAAQNRPVMVLVTSRTVVADRVVIPDGTTVIKLEGFDREQVTSWLKVWNHANTKVIASGNVRGLSPAAALSQIELAQQPLLLLMLALYTADPASPPLDGSTSKTDLYRRLLTNFTRREITKVDANLREGELSRAVHDQLWRLSIAAFAMFNRGRQDVTDVELGLDLAALDDRIATDIHRAELGQQLIGRFFFMHAAEAQTGTARGVRRCYEFMHSTFGEYLLATLLIELIAELAAPPLTSRPGTRELNDDMLYALLSHQPLAGRQQMLTFTRELFSEFTPPERDLMLSALESLIRTHRRRHGSDLFIRYRPMPVDRVRQLAAYSANLIVVRVQLEPPDSFIPLALLWPDHDDPIRLWRSTVALWNSGLDTDGWYSMLSAIKYLDGALSAMHDDEVLPVNLADVLHARLIGDSIKETHLRFGHAINNGTLYSLPGDRWEDIVISGLILRLVDRPVKLILPDPPEDLTTSAADEVIRIFTMIMKLHGGTGSNDELDDLAKLILKIMNPTEKATPNRRPPWLPKQPS